MKTYANIKDLHGYYDDLSLFRVESRERKREYAAACEG
jgi:hypothetical protein